ncbi:hypothetical protein ACFQDG_08040 [Natronoarchaeum mannanilyticum]|uniref:DUF8106 domain-containing protein n=1 Tax=Natronoarchaeum mannanilyticum TaxID=926360 RepID=A0AAV3TFV1_9EURY
MTPARIPSSEIPDDRPPDATRKAVLCCPDCDHRSPPAGDWISRSVGDREIRRCPECNAVIERRPTFDDRDESDTPRPLATLNGAAHEAFVRSMAVVRIGISTPARAVADAVDLR